MGEQGGERGEKEKHKWRQVEIGKEGGRTGEEEEEKEERKKGSTTYLPRLCVISKGSCTQR